MNTNSRAHPEESGARLEKAFAERLLELRLERGLTVAAFAEVTDTKIQTVRDWLNARVLPQVKALHRIASTFGVSTDWLLGLPGAPKLPTRWTRQEDFFADLAEAVTAQLRERGGAAAGLADEFHIDGEELLELATDRAEEALVQQANAMKSWLPFTETIAEIARLRALAQARLSLDANSRDENPSSRAAPNSRSKPERKPAGDVSAHVDRLLSHITDGPLPARSGKYEERRKATRGRGPKAFVIVRSNQDIASEDSPRPSTPDAKSGAESDASAGAGTSASAELDRQRRIVEELDRYRALHAERSAWDE